MRSGGRTESKIMPLEDTLAVQRILNQASEQLGVYHSKTAQWLCDMRAEPVEALEPAEAPFDQGWAHYAST